MSDLFGFSAPKPEFKDIGNQRPSVAEEKAELCLKLGKLCNTAPTSMSTASINFVRAWKDAQKSALKTLNSRSSSRTDLQSAINNMERFK